MNSFILCTQLVRAATKKNWISPIDETYLTNRLLALLEHDRLPTYVSDTQDSIPELLARLSLLALGQDAALDKREQLEAALVDIILPRPSDVNERFWSFYANQASDATKYFYKMSQDSNYIQMKRVEQNIYYTTATPYGTLEVTINLSKPEKDPQQIVRERTVGPKGNELACLLCVENEGYAGRTNHPARAHHRMIRVMLDGEKWLFQYSPYVYYNEHSIILSSTHRDMTITEGTFRRLISFVDQFPTYFIGSNADLPIVGGSILAHDHYQGGRHQFAMEDAELEYTFSIPGFPNVACETLIWPLSVIRLTCADGNELVRAASKVQQFFKEYSDKTIDLIARTDNQHNTITPIARSRKGNFELDLVLRNNRTSTSYPEGIFHPHQDVHHIKKENIGLIEVMGLAVLPARLKHELKEVELFVLGLPNDIADIHLPFAQMLRKQFGDIATLETIEDIIRTAVGQKFIRALEDAGIFKRTTVGKEAFMRFIHLLTT